MPRYVKRTRPGTFRGRVVGPRPVYRRTLRPFFAYGPNRVGSFSNQNQVQARQRVIANIRSAGLLGVELKYLDAPKAATALTAPTDASGGEMDPSSVVTGCLSAPAQGDGPTNRDGSKIVMKRIYVTGTILVGAQAAQAAADIVPSILICLVLDKQTNGQQLNSEDVFVNQNASANTATNPQRNMSFTNRFEVLKTVQFMLPQPYAFNDAATTAAQGGISKPFKLKKSFGLEGLRVQFTTGGTTADVANVIDNSLHIIAFCSSANLAPSIQYNSRMRFVG